MDTKDIKKLFNTLYGVDVNLKQPKQTAPPTIDYTKQFFIRSITEWRNAAKVSAKLNDSFGIDLSGYDKQLFDSLESIYFSFLGNIKASIILSYVYCPLNLEVELFKIIDKYQKEYIIKNVEDLYYFIIRDCKDENFLQEE